MIREDRPAGSSSSRPAAPPTSADGRPLTRSGRGAPISRRVFVARSTRLLGAAGLIGASGGLLAACGDDDDAERSGSAASGKVIRPRIASSTSVIPIFVHQLAGPVRYGREHGLNMTREDILEFESHTVAIQTVLSRKAEVISGSIFGSMAAVSQGLPIKIFAATRNRDDNVLAGVPPARTFDDIFKENVRVSSDSKGGTSNSELQAIIEHVKGEGIAADSLPGYTVLESSGQRQAALAAGQVDAAMMHIDQFWAVEEENREAKILASSVDTPVFPINAFAALVPWLDENQATATAMAKSVASACEAFIADFNEYKDTVDEFVEEPPAEDVLKRLWEFAVENDIWPTDPRLSREAYDRSAGLAQQAEVFIEPPPYEEAVDTRAMEAAAAA
jgi:ABC-type nitrate/sulfonate/bicarbonate transport system substrate-binding protein